MASCKRELSILFPSAFPIFQTSKNLNRMFFAFPLPAYQCFEAEILPSQGKNFVFLYLLYRIHFLSTTKQTLKDGNSVFR